MRPAVRVGRRSSLVRRPASGGGGGGTETVQINSVSAFAGTVTGGPSNNNAGALTALSDGSDTTYIAHTIFSYGIYCNATVGFADLVNAGGATHVASFTVTIRRSGGSGSNIAYADPTATPTPSPGDDTNSGLGSGQTDEVLGPFTGPFTVAQFNAMTCQLQLVADAGSLRMIGAWATATLA